MVELSRASAVRSVDFGIVERFLRTDRPLQQFLRALVGNARVGNRRLVLGNGGPLKVRVQAEQLRAGRHLLALADVQRLDAAHLVRSDEQQLGLHPALKFQGGRTAMQIETASKEVLRAVYRSKMG